MFLRRLLLIVFTLALPALITYCSYVGAVYLLVHTNHYVSQPMLSLAGLIEFGALFFIAVLEAKARWTPRPAN